MMKRYCPYCLDLCARRCGKCGSESKPVSSIPQNIGPDGWLAQTLSGCSPALIRAVGKHNPGFVLAEGALSADLANELATSAPYEALRFYREKLTPEVRLECERLTIQDDRPLWDEAFFKDAEEDDDRYDESEEEE